MNILHVTPFFAPAWAYGGMARASASLCRAQARAGHRVVAVTARLDPSHPPEEEADGLRVIRLSGLALANRVLLPWSARLGPTLRAEAARADVAHVHGHRSGFAVSAASVFSDLGLPWVLQPHGTLPSHRHRRAAKWVFDRLAGDAVVRRAPMLLALSEAEARDLPRPSLVVGSGVEAVGVAGAAGAQASGQGGGGEGPARLLFVGSDRFRRKRAELLPALLRGLPGATLDLVGSFRAGFIGRFGPDSSRVRVRGVLAGEALAAAYAGADLLVHLAEGEAFGLVPFEAALHGTAGVVVGGHGCGEWYGRAGGCVTGAGIDEVARAAAARLHDRALASAEAQAVSAFAARELTWERVAVASVSAYEAVHRGARPR